MRRRSRTAFAREPSNSSKGEFDDASLFVLKDPRACRLVPFWLDTLRHAAIEPHVIIPYRAPLEVAKSLAVRSGMPLEAGIALWLRHALDAERDSRGIRRSFIFMNALLSDWRTSLDRIARELGLSWPKDTADVALQLDAFLSPMLKHHASDSRNPVVKWAADASQAFSTLSKDPESSPAQSSLDAIGAAFDQACDLFGAFGYPDAPLPSNRNGEPVSNDNQPDLPCEEANIVLSRRQGHLWSLQAQAAELRDRLLALREQAKTTGG